MTLVSGPLSTVTTTPSAVSQVNISINSPRTRGTGVITPEVKTVTVTGGVFSSQIEPGPAVLTLFVGVRKSVTIPILVDDIPSQTLANAVNAAKVATSDHKEWLEKLAAEVIAGTEGPPGQPGQPGPPGPTGPTGTLDLIDESVQTTIDTVVAPAINAVAEDWIDRLVQAGGAIGGGLQPLGPVVETVTLDPPVIGGTKVLTLTGDVRIFLKFAVPGDVMTLIVTQGPGAPHTVTWPGSISWQGGPPELSDVEGRADVITLLCVNGMSWLGFVSGQDMTVPPREIRDSFNRPDAPTLGGTDTGQVWVSSGWTISDSQARAIEGGARAVVDTAEADRVEVSVRPPTGGGASVVHFRMGVRENAEGTSFYRLVWTNLINNNTYIQRNDGTTQAMIGSYFSLGAVVGDRIALRCIVTDDVATLTVSRNGEVIHTVTDDTPIPDGTYAGIVNINSAPTTIGSAVIDDFQVVYP